MIIVGSHRVIRLRIFLPDYFNAQSKGFACRFAFVWRKLPPEICHPGKATPLLRVLPHVEGRRSPAAIVIPVWERQPADQSVDSNARLLGFGVVEPAGLLASFPRCMNRDLSHRPVVLSSRPVAT